MRRWAVIGVIVAAVGITGEVALRMATGLGRPALSYADPDFGYAFKADQDLTRFGRRIRYNAQGMRSEDLAAMGNRKRVLCIGDSVTNGGAPTDQADTYPYRLEGCLRGRGWDMAVMNISAGSWGIENQLGYLRKHGIHGAGIVVVQIGSHDLYQKKSEGAIVGNDPNFPDANPPLALWELGERYAWPRVSSRLGLQAAEPEKERTREDLERNLGALRELVGVMRGAGAEVLILFTCNTDEAVAGRSRAEGLKDLRALAAAMDVRLMEMLPVWHGAIREGQHVMRDGVHPNELGSELMARTVCEALASGGGE